MNLEQELRNDILILRPRGRLDSSSSPELERVVTEQLDSGIQRLVFDLSGLDYISSAGLRVVRDGALLDGKVEDVDLDNGTLAGSTLNINKGLRILVEEAMVPFNYALNACTINPARCLHLDDRKGSIQIGKDADLVVLDDNYDVLQTYCMGKAQL